MHFYTHILELKFGRLRILCTIGFGEIFHMVHSYSSSANFGQIYIENCQNAQLNFPQKLVELSAQNGLMLPEMAEFWPNQPKLTHFGRNLTVQISAVFE
jgi:hypothetical protein